MYLFALNLSILGPDQMCVIVSIIAVLGSDLMPQSITQWKQADWASWSVEKMKR
jgi:hypothetical protein